MSIRRTAVVVVSALAIAGAAEAATPKPWQWTNAQAAAKVDEAFDRAHHVAETYGSAGPSKCRKVGTGFACSFPWRVRLSDPAKTLTAYVKVRPVGKGGACISLKSFAAVRPACLAARGLVASDEGKAYREVQKAVGARLGLPGPIIGVNTPNECVGVDGFYECAFSSGASGTATVAFRATGVTVRVTSISCAPDVAAKYPTGCTFP